MFIVVALKCDMTDKDLAPGARNQVGMTKIYNYTNMCTD